MHNQFGIALHQSHFSFSSVAVGCSRSQSLLDVDDNFGLFELFLQLLITLLKSRLFNRKRIRFWTSIEGFKSVRISSGHLPSPIGQIGRIEPFPTHQGVYLTIILAGGATSFRTRRLYSAVKLRHSGLDRTSGSGAAPGWCCSDWLRSLIALRPVH